MTARRAALVLPTDSDVLARRLRVAFYGRISANKKHASLSIPGQLRKYLEFMARHPQLSEVDRYADDNRSASRFRSRNRDDWGRLLADLPTGRIQLLWCWEWSRGNRDVREFGALIDLLAAHGVLIYLHRRRRVYDPRLAQDVNDLAQESVNADRESLLISQRVSESVMDSIDAGTPWGTLRYGYRRTYDPYSRKLVSQDAHPQRADVVREVCKRYADNEPQLQIAADLTARGVETPGDALWNDAHPGEQPRRSRWTEVAVQRMACSPVYIGHRLYRGKQRIGETKVFDGEWEALIDEDTHIACVRRHQVAAAVDAARRIGAAGLAHLLTGIMRCGVCGGPTTIRSLPTGNRYRCRDGCCSAPETQVDAFVVAALLTWCARKDVARRLTMGESAAAIGARRELASLQQERAEWVAAMEEIGPVETRKVLRSVDAKIKAATERMHAAAVPAALRKLLGTPKGAAAAWQGMDLPQQRAAIDELMVLKLQPAGRGTRTFNAARSVTIEWRG